MGPMGYTKPFPQVWPKISKMMTSILGPSAVGTGRLPFTLRDDSMMDLVCHRISDRCQDRDLGEFEIRNPRFLEGLVGWFLMVFAWKKNVKKKSR